MKTRSVLFSLVLVGILLACQPLGGLAPSVAPTATAPPTAVPSPTTIPTISPTPTKEPLAVSITLGSANTSNGITLDSGGDVDTLSVQAGSLEARTTGNGEVLFASDGNNVPDMYIQFNVDDNRMYAGSPSSHVRVEVDYLDQGLDTFSIEYDAKPSASFDGSFAGGGAIVKTNSGEFKTGIFNLCDAFFSNRVNGADFRLSDDGNGAEIIREVRVYGYEAAITTFHVDDFGANPFDDLPDSTAIQSALDSTCSGDTVVFTSGVDNPDYRGYLVDKTIFLTGMTAKHDLTFTASDPNNHALLHATQDLLGFVVSLFARSRFNNTKNIYNIDFGYIDIHGGRDVRVCMGSDGVGNGEGDNWGSWLPECDIFDDATCSPGNLNFVGFTSNVVIHDLINAQTECGTALGFSGDGGTIRNVTIDTAGDHNHRQVCANTDPDTDVGFAGWADGITLVGPNHTVTENTIINPSDIGIVHFGGQNTVITNNRVISTAGNYGAFGAIALHPWDVADASGVVVSGNTIINESDTECGGLHMGINIGAHMWNWGCVKGTMPETIGNPGCEADPDPALAGPCPEGTCQLWLVVPEGGELVMRDNVVSGTQLNYFIEGMIIEGQFVDENNISQAPRLTDWYEARVGCYGVPWGPLDKAAHHPTLPGYTDILIHCQ